MVSRRSSSAPQPRVSRRARLLDHGGRWRSLLNHRGGEARTCRRRWLTCRPGRPSGRWCTACSSTPTRTRRTSRPSSDATSRSSAAGGRWTRRPTSWPRRCCRCSTPRSVRSPAACASWTSALPDRLRELDFEFPLVGGDRPDRAFPEVHLGLIAAVLRRHLSGRRPDAGLRRPAESPSLGGQLLRGYLSGSIDVVLRVPDSGTAGQHRFLVVDYKTNRLGDPSDR